jgi:hypothetical protein
MHLSEESSHDYYRQNPTKRPAFFRPLQDHFSRPAWSHFCGLVLAMAVGHRSTMARLSELLRSTTHRTNHGEFLWRSVWDETLVMQQIALDLLQSLWRNGKDNSCYLILDDTQTLNHRSRGLGQCHTRRRLLWPCRGDLQTTQGTETENPCPTSGKEYKIP